MKYIYLWVNLLIFPFVVHAQIEQLGVPFFKNYSSADYSANSRNEDIIADGSGNVFVANFEGLLYYDQATWRILRLTNFTRPTALYSDNQGTLWVEGYNYFGKVVVKSNGDISLESVVADDAHLLQLRKSRTQTEFDQEKLPGIDVSVNHVLKLNNGLMAVATMGRGLFIYSSGGKLLCNITEQNGLCSNNINRLAYNGNGLLWGATENGIFSMSIPSAYTHFSQTEGLHGEVYSICKFAGVIYVGTTSGLYRQQGMMFNHINNVNHLCWAMKEMDGQLLVASEGGLYILSSNGGTRQINSIPTRALFVSDDFFYTGEDEGVFLNKLDGTRYQICKQSNVTHILKDEEGKIWLQTLYGEIWIRKNNAVSFEKYTNGISKDDNGSLMRATLVEMNGKVLIIDVLDEEPFSYPQFSHTDNSGNTWLTDNNYCNLYVWKNGKRLTNIDDVLYPLRNNVVRSIWIEQKQLWIGGKDGLSVVDLLINDSLIHSQPNLHIRSIIANGDSILWGGMGKQPTILNRLKNNQNNLIFTYPLDKVFMQSDALYQYRMNNNEWSKPSIETSAVFNNQRSGSHTFQVKAIDAWGHESEIVSIEFSIQAPFYIQWYMIVLYVIILALSVYFLMQWRTKRLEIEKIRLESIVGERTAEVVKQRDEIVMQKNEIEEKSKSLETALSELNQAQSELIRQEKMATIGKLTQGLIDRILNPLNYINNFSKLSQGLVKDIEANIEDEKEHLSEEIYEDTKDVLSMLTGNLEKVSEHGQNTTRTLKAMEEMLKDRSGGINTVNLTNVLHQNEEMLHTYYAKEIGETHINVVFDYPNNGMMVNGNAEQLSKTFMSLLGNSVYAIVKKAQRETFAPEIILKATVDNNKLILVFHDNGIGIEETIIDKVFDPFFTTKTTSEASGVGLYLSRETVQNYGGDISVKSIKNGYTEFTIVLPKID